MKELTHDQMEAVKGGLPCWAAKAALIVAGITFTVGTVGWGTLALGMLGLGLAEWAHLESCFPQLMD